MSKKMTVMSNAKQPQPSIEAIQEFCRREGRPVMGKEMTGYNLHLVMNHGKRISEIEKELKDDKD